MKINEEISTSGIEIEDADSLSEYFLLLKKAINDETAAITLYDKMLKSNAIPKLTKEILSEILDDEKDHIVLLTELLQDEIEEELPEYGDDKGIEIFGENY